MGYEFPFTKENVDSIHKLANDRSRNNRTEYIVSEYKGGRRFTILSYEDFRDKSFEELQTGKPPLIQQEVPKKK
jgi:hypothetical protein